MFLRYLIYLMSGLTDCCLVNSSLLRRGKRLLVGLGRLLSRDLLHLLAGVLSLAVYINLGLGCAQKHRSRHGSIRSLINLVWQVDGAIRRLAFSSYFILATWNPNPNPNPNYERKTNCGGQIAPSGVICGLSTCQGPRVHCISELSNQ